MKRSILDEGNIQILLGLGFDDFIEIEGRFRKLTELRKKVLLDKGIFLPVMTTLVDYDSELPEFDVRLDLLDVLKLQKTFDPKDKNCFDAIITFVCKMIYEHAEFFKDFDYEAEIIRLEKERSREGYRKILLYYMHINPNKKAQFHYTKKIASFGFPEDLMELEKALRCGMGCQVDEMQARKISYQRYRKNWKKDQVF